MLATINRPTREVTWGLAAVIAVVLVAGVVGVFTTSGGGSKGSTSQPTATTTPSGQPTSDAAAAAADQKAYNLILANQNACNARYLPDAKARHQAALDQLKEQEAALTAVLDQLPPGKAKDILAAQIRPDFDSSTQLVESELKSAESRCALAFTVYQYTHQTTPPP